jgi:peptidoglycan/xylan/chitin deacetylase (PgdA/CDA1 family)
MTWHDDRVDSSLVSRAGMSGLKRMAAACDRFSRTERGITVLAYHRVGRRSRVRVDLPDWLFEEEMERLSGGPGVVDLDVALTALAGRAVPNGRDPVVVTFDDGTADFVDVALPILVRCRVPVTIYVATEFIEAGRAFPDGGRPVSWAALADALSTGLVTIGSHTHSHALLDRLPADAIPGELDRSIELIGERTGVLTRHFAYPKALRGSVAAERAVRSRFVSAALAGTRPNLYGRTDPHRLARSPVQVDDGLRFFGRKASGGMRVEDDLRRLAGRWRFARAHS